MRTILVVILTAICGCLPELPELGRNSDPNPKPVNGGCMAPYDDDDYDDDVQFIIPGADFRHAEQNAPDKQGASTEWAMLTMGRTIGKKVNIAVPTTTGGVIPPGPSLNLLEIAGGDTNALQLCITLGVPQFIPASQFPGGVVPANNSIINSATGERDNFDFLMVPPPLNGFSWVPTIAVIEWGIGGVQSKAQVDWVNGTTINLTASWVRVSAFVDGVNRGGFDIDGGVVSLTAWVGPGFARSDSAQRTVSIGNILAGPIVPPAGFPGTGFGPVSASFARNIFPVPYFSKFATFSGIIPDITGTFSALDYSVMLIFYRNNRPQDPIGAFRFTNNNREPARIPNGAQWFTVTNEVATTIFDSVVIFDLTI